LTDWRKSAKLFVVTPAKAKEVQGRLHEVFDQLGRSLGWKGPEVSAYLSGVVREAGPLMYAGLALAQSLGAQFDPQDVLQLAVTIGDSAAELRYLEALPEERGAMLEANLDMVIARILPGVKAATRTISGSLSQSQRGGAKATKWPDAPTCKRICQRLRALQQNDIPMETAKQMVADSFSLSKRMVERIWARRKEYLA